MRGLLLLLVAVSVAFPQVNSPPSYLLRLEHSSFESHSCALLQSTGAFHLEVDHDEQVKVFEGSVEPNQLLEIQRNLNSDPLVTLSQQKIEEPLIRTRHDELQITVFREDHWQDLLFRSSDSQQPFEQSLQPLVHWLDNLHKLPHRELSEDEGKNNCLPPKAIVLKKRETATSSTSLTPR